jgi:hypothetical protein
LELNTEALLSVPIKDDEIFELLERLAATEEMFKAPVSTIRDVAELTDASPNLIARLLGEMRGPGEYEKLLDGFVDHEERIRKLEKNAKVKAKGKPFELKQPPRSIENIPVVPVSSMSEERKLLSEPIEGRYQEPNRNINLPNIVVAIMVALAIVVASYIVVSANTRIDRPSLPPTYQIR